MTNSVKRIVGFVGTLLGALGMALCLAVIVGAWWINEPLTNGLLTVFPPIEAALAFGDTTAERFGVIVDDTQTQFNETADSKPIATRIAVVVWFHFWLRGLANTSLAERHRVNREAWLVNLADVLTAMRERGEIGAGIDVSAEVVGVDAFINGIALRAILNPDDWSAERQLSELRRYLKRLR